MPICCVWVDHGLQTQRSVLFQLCVNKFHIIVVMRLVLHHMAYYS